jgi:putative ATPase
VTLFEPDEPAAEAAEFDPNAPLAARMRPRTLDEVVGQDHLLAPGSPMHRLVEGDAPISLILYGPPGTGKTTLALIVSTATNRRFVQLSALNAGVKDVREVIATAKSDLGRTGRQTVLFIDEIHRFSKTQQDSLLLTLEPLSDDDLGILVDRAVSDERGLAGRVVLDPEARAMIIRLASGDARRALTALEAASVSATSGSDADADGDAAASGTPVVTSEIVATAVDRALLRYDRNGDEHYDVISAFIKSVRGSDVDASLHYLARMIEAGEDPRFIARRIIVLASEDIGMADPQALVVAVAAADAVQLIGMPEGRIPLAQAVVHLATAPKSNAAYMALDAAISDVRAGKGGRVPKHLRDAHYPGAKRLGHGKGYKYPHDDVLGVLEQQYPPTELRHVRYYEPTEHGNEREVSARLAKLRRIVRGR